MRDHFSKVKRPVHVVAASAVFRASKIVTSRMEEALGGVDLTPQRFELLGLLANSEGGTLALRELRRATLYHAATLTYTVDTLVKKGMLTRVADDVDRRSVRAVITTKGRKVVESAIVLLDDITWGLNDLSTEDASAVAQILSRIQPT